MSVSDKSKFSTKYISNLMEKLKCNKHKKSTAKTYHGIWKRFNEFVLKLDHIPRRWEERLSLYCLYLIEIVGLQSSTIKTYVSAIKDTLVTDGYQWQDNLLLLRTLTSACRTQNDIFRTRLPIQKGLLDMILFEVERKYEHDSCQPFLKVLYQAIFVLAYYGLLRIGEITKSEHTLKAKDVHISGKPKSILLLLHSSKTHGKESRPQKIKISNSTMHPSEHMSFSPFDIIQEYLSIRGGYYTEDESFFILPDHSPLEAKQVRKVLRQCLKKLQLNARIYDTHSFRIGRATDLLKYGFSVDKIKQIGRWRSNAVYAYLRN